MSERRGCKLDPRVGCRGQNKREAKVGSCKALKATVRSLDLILTTMENH